MILMDGKKLRDKILSELKIKIENQRIEAMLAIILAGDDAASKIYVRNKENACKDIGIKCNTFTFPSNTSEETICDLINSLNSDENVTGIILQSPVPEQINFDKCSNLIDSSKDVDGFTMDNIYNLYLDNDKLIPCTVKGIIRLLDEYRINLEGANVVIVGRGKIVGRPLMLALLNRSATVTIVHSKSKNLSDITKTADILISAVGESNLITADMVKENAVVIDVGISRVDGKISGDVDFENVSKKASFITPVPGGVGPMTVAMIMENVLKAKEVGGKNG